MVCYLIWCNISHWMYNSLRNSGPQMALSSLETHSDTLVESTVNVNPYKTHYPSTHANNVIAYSNTEAKIQNVELIT